MAKYHRDPAGPPIPVNSKIPSVYLDDKAITLEALSTYTMEDMHRVEAYGNRGERQIRFYTSGYLRLVEAGLITPSSISVRLETFEFPVPWQDSLHAPRIRR